MNQTYIISRHPNDTTSFHHPRLSIVAVVGASSVYFSPPHFLQWWIPLMFLSLPPSTTFSFQLKEERVTASMLMETKVRRCNDYELSNYLLISYHVPTSPNTSFIVQPTHLSKHPRNTRDLRSGILLPTS